MSQEHPFAWTGSFEMLPTVTLGALALGAGGRFIRGIVESAGPEEAAEVSTKLRAGVPPVAKIPVTVTPEEAEVLRRKGVKVRQLHEKAAAQSPSFWNSIGYGAAASGAGILGWELSDWILDTMRKRKAKDDVERSRERLSRLMDQGEVDKQDVKLAAALTDAEEQWVKYAENKGPFGWISDAADTFGTLSALGGLGIGAGTVLGFLASMREARRMGKAMQKIKALKRFSERRSVEPPYATMEPVVVEPGK